MAKFYLWTNAASILVQSFGVRALASDERAIRLGISPPMIALADPTVDNQTVPWAIDSLKWMNGRPEMSLATTFPHCLEEAAMALPDL